MAAGRGTNTDQVSFDAQNLYGECYPPRLRWLEPFAILFYAALLPNVVDRSTCRQALGLGTRDDCIDAGHWGTPISLAAHPRGEICGGDKAH